MIAILVLLVLVAKTHAADAPPATAPAAPPTTAPTSAPSSAVDSIHFAPNPSAAVDAYARAIANSPADADAIKHAYIHRMIEFGMPELAETQARELNQRGQSTGDVLGVLAYVYAAHGDYPASIQQLKMALNQSPDDPFLLRTAGQLAAWYDAQTDRSMLSATDTQMLESIRSAAQNKPAFADAYRASTQPISPPPNAPHADANAYQQETGQPTYIAPSSAYVPAYDYVYYDYPYYRYPYYSYSYPVFSDPFCRGPYYPWWRWHSFLPSVDHHHLAPLLPHHDDVIIRHGSGIDAIRTRPDVITGNRDGVSLRGSDRTTLQSMQPAPRMGPMPQASPVPAPAPAPRGAPMRSSGSGGHASSSSVGSSGGSSSGSSQGGTAHR